MCQDFLVGNLLKISLEFPLDFLAGKLKNTGSELLCQNCTWIKYM